MALILASASPRRQQLLEQIGCSFTVVTSDVDEDNNQVMLPHELAVHHAQAKAINVAAKVGQNDIIIGADTIVVVDGQVYGKPVDMDDARRMLINLAGRTHKVITGIAVVSGSTTLADFVTTEVKIAQLSEDEIERYIATGEPMDKAGAYAIQGIGTLFVEGINGCYTNVVGLPLNALAKLMKKVGISLL